MMTKHAELSACRTYRHWLTRGRGDFSGWMVFVMLNPSTADALVDDHTIRRCITLAAREKCSGIAVVNLFTHRATEPRELWADETRDPIGPQQSEAIGRAMYLVHRGGKLVVAWGGLSSRGIPAWFREMRRDRIAHVLQTAELMVLPVWCFGTTADGEPRHPSRLSNADPLVPFDETKARKLFQINRDPVEV